MRDKWDQQHWVAMIAIEKDPSIDGMRAEVHLSRHRQPDIFGNGWAVRTADDPEGAFAEDLATARALTDVAIQLRTRYKRTPRHGGTAVPARPGRSAVPV